MLLMFATLAFSIGNLFSGRQENSRAAPLKVACSKSIVSGSRSLELNSIVIKSKEQLLKWRESSGNVTLANARNMSGSCAEDIMYYVAGNFILSDQKVYRMLDHGVLISYGDIRYESFIIHLDKDDYSREFVTNSASVIDRIVLNNIAMVRYLALSRVGKVTTLSVITLDEHLRVKKVEVLASTTALVIGASFLPSIDAPGGVISIVLKAGKTASISQFYWQRS